MSASCPTSSAATSRASGADETLRRKIIIRVPMIHGVNDGEDNITALRDYMLRLGLDTVNLLPYHNMGIGKAREAGIEQGGV